MRLGKTSLGSVSVATPLLAALLCGTDATSAAAQTLPHACTDATAVLRAAYRDAPAGASSRWSSARLATAFREYAICAHSAVEPSDRGYAVVGELRASLDLVEYEVQRAKASRGRRGDASVRQRYRSTIASATGWMRRAKRVIDGANHEPESLFPSDMQAVDRFYERYKAYRVTLRHLAAR